MQIWIVSACIATAVLPLLFLLWGLGWALHALRIAVDDWPGFYERWPAITEQEFLAKCSKGVDPQVALRVRQIIANQLGVPYKHIHPDQSFVNDLGCE